MEEFPRNCGFLSLVVVERVLHPKSAGFCGDLGLTLDPPTRQRSQNPPWLKKSKKVFGRVSRKVSEGPGRPPKTSQKRVSWTLRVKNHLLFDSGDSFLTRFGGVGQDSRRLPQRLSWRLFSGFLSQGGLLTPLPGRGGRKACCGFKIKSATAEPSNFQSQSSSINIFM